MHVVFCSHLCARTREVGVSSRNLVSRTFPHFLLHVCMKYINISDFQFDQIQNNLDIWHYVWFTLCGASRDQVCIDYASLPFI